MSAIVGGVPVCGWCLETMRCVKNEVTLLIGDERPDRERGAYCCDLFECRRCQMTQVLMPAPRKHHLDEDAIDRLKDAGESVLDVNTDWVTTANGVAISPRTQEKK